MTDVDIGAGAFEVGQGFEAGETSGNVRIGRFEAQYEELFGQAIADGVITPEERALLDAKADELGLDRQRVMRLELALLAAYQARHKTTVRHLDELAPPMSLAPLEPATDARTLALERRIKQLEARVVELERELEEARAHVAVEIDLSEVATPAASEESEAELVRRLRADPTDVSSLRALSALLTREGELDRAYCVAMVLEHLGAAGDEEKALVLRGRGDGLIKPRGALAPEAWAQSLYHPEEEILTGQIFAVVVSAVLLGRVAALRNQRALPSLDPARRLDPKTSTVQAARCFQWGASILGMSAPPLFADPSLEAVVEMVPGIPPSSRLGRLALSGRSATELAFAAGQHLAWYREERFMRLLIPSIVDLEDVFLSALVIGNPGLPLSGDVKRRVAPIAQAIEPLLEPAQVDRLRGSFLRFVEEGGRTNLARWATAADRTAARAGLLLSNDLRAAEVVLGLGRPLEGQPGPAELVRDLYAFLVTGRATRLRKQLGVAL